MIKGKGADILKEGQRVLALEAESLKKLALNLPPSFVTAVEQIAANRGHIVTSGMGKAGHIAMKVAATMASTGTPAFFMHPAEAVHGDLGMLASGDLALLFSNSGETDELCRLLPFLVDRQIYTIAITAHDSSTLAKGSDLVIPLGDIQEACPLQLAPSSSTTCMLALGDAISFAVLEAKGFTADDFAKLHPAGALGKSLCQVDEIMRVKERCPVVSIDTPVRQVVSAISKARAGCACIVDKEGHLLGVFTDGDFRRAWAEDDQLALKEVGQVMTAPGKSLRQHTLVRDAKVIMTKHHINALPVVDANNLVLGLLDIQDI